MTRRWIGPKHAPAVVLAVLTSLVLLGTASTAVAVPRNDDFAHARAVRAGTTVKGNVNGATRQRGEPRHANSLAMRSVWYRFRAKRKVTLALGTCRTTFDSVIAVYTGRSLRTLREVEFNNNGCGGGGGSRVTFTAKPGRTYRIAVAGFTASGRFRLAVSSVPVPPNDDFADAARLDVVVGQERQQVLDRGLRGDGDDRLARLGGDDLSDAHARRLAQEEGAR